MDRCPVCHLPMTLLSSADGPAVCDQHGPGWRRTGTRMYSIIRGYLELYSNPHRTYRGEWTPTDETPEVGDDVEYWRCGDNQSQSFSMPAVGGMVIVRHCPRDWTTIILGTARLERVDYHRFTTATAVGDVPDSYAWFRRVA